ncbi:MAG: DUF2782 domain-containing protein [Wenzhouxiangella sp.]|jgi:hypothetical protein|nr:DUF2782 domain-containing protein [Wenzhouxiangella sp.]
MKYTLIPLLLMLAAPVSLAQQSDVPPPPPLPEPEPLPPKVQDPDEQIEPTVIIRREDDRIIEEYQSNGVVFMIRVVPDVGPAYYLVDTTGDGNFNERFAHDQIDPIRPAHWKIAEW